MGLLTRMTTLLKADAHGVVDSIEDRSLLLKQHLREAEAALARKRARLDALNAEEKESREGMKRLGLAIRRLEDDVSLALDGDKEELARFALKKLLGLKRRVEQLEQRGKRLKEEREELEERCEQQELELVELRARVKGYLARAEAGEADERFLEPIVEDEEVEIELLRRRNERNPKGDG